MITYEELKMGDVFYRIKDFYKIEQLTFISMDDKSNHWYKFNAWFYVNDKNNVEFINIQDFSNTCFSIEYEVNREILINLITKFMTINTDYMVGIRHYFFDRLDEKDKEKIKDMSKKMIELIFEIDDCIKEIDRRLNK